MTAAKPSGDLVRLFVDGAERQVPGATSLAVALLVSGPFRQAPGGARPVRRVRVFCGMGSCYECTATVDGVSGVRTCITPLADGMRVETGSQNTHNRSEGGGR